MLITRRKTHELAVAFTAILALGAAYFYIVYTEAVPPPRGLLGHLLGVVGFMLMLMTETLYSLRKRSRMAKWGRLSKWLQFHIFTGLVGPFLVLLHSSWKFNGLAGLVTVLTIAIVVSGFIGRYIYTSIPRTAEGEEVGDAAALASARRLLAVWHAVHIPIGMVLFTAAFIHIAAALYYATLSR